MKKCVKLVIGKKRDSVISNGKEMIKVALKHVVKVRRGYGGIAVLFL